MKEEWEEQFDKVFNKARGEHNIVGDLMVKDFIRKVLASQKKEILEKVETELKKYKCGKHKRLFKLLQKE